MRVLRYSLLLGLMILSALPIAAQFSPNAAVIDMWEQLNLRAAPDRAAAVVVELPGETPVLVLARTSDNVWFRLRTAEGVEGYAAAGFIALDVPLWEIPVDGAPVSAPAAAGPADAPASEPPAADLAASMDGANGRVAGSAWGGLNLRDAPNGARLTTLAPGTPLIVLERAGDWLRVQAGEQVGYVAARYVDFTGEVPQGDASSTLPAAALPAGVAAIIQRGRELGNRADRFSRVGDSITANELFLRPISYAPVALGPYSDLRPVIDHFSAGGSFAHRSLAAWPGWTSGDLLDPARANPGQCRAGESPLACEYRVMRPTIALIMIGSNDVAVLDVATYAANLDAIARLSIEAGVLPVFSTLPPRLGYDGAVAAFNDRIRQTAERYGLPLWDYHAAMMGLPDQGLSPDGLHPSEPPGGAGYAVNFTDAYVRYGMVTRNLTALQQLNTLWRDALR